MGNDPRFRCPCGQNHTDLVERVAQGADVPFDWFAGTMPVQVLGAERRYAVPRIFIAAHGINARNLAETAKAYGFAEAREDD